MSVREKELASYKNTWLNKPKPQVIEEIASYSMETKNLPDPYFFLISEKGFLISPITGIAVEQSVEKKSLVGQQEFQALKKIQDWSSNYPENQIALWISPPEKDRYPTAKIIISEVIGKENKSLFNRAIILNFSEQECINLANDLSNSEKYLSSEDLRSQPLFITVVNNGNWVNLLKTKIQHPEAWDIIDKGIDLEEKEKAIENAAVIYQELFNQDQLIGFDDYQIKKTVIKANEIKAFGSNQVSCPPSSLTASETFFQNALKKEDGKYVKKCGNCGTSVEKVITAGYKCPKCGCTYEGC